MSANGYKSLVRQDDTPAFRRPEYGQLLPLDEAAAYISVTPRWLRRQWSERRIAAIRLSPRCIRFATADLDQLVVSGRVEAVR